MSDDIYFEREVEKYEGMLIKPYYKEHKLKEKGYRLWGAHIFCSHCGVRINNISGRLSRDEAIKGAKEYIDGVRDGMKVINSRGHD